MKPSTNNLKPSGEESSGNATPPFFGRSAYHVIHKLPVGVVSFDSELNIIDSNSCAQELLTLSETADQSLANGMAPETNTDWNTEIHNVLQSNSTHTFDPVTYSKNGRQHMLQVICTPLIDERTQETLGGILLIENVSLKLAMAHDLAEAERLAAVGKLAARVAHELNNPLDGIMRYINLAMRVMENNNPNQASLYLHESRKGLMRMVQIISELLEFSRSTYSAFEEADFNKIVEEAVKAMDAQAADHHVKIVKSYSPDMPNIRSGNLFQVFCNLIKNAIDAMPNGGRLEIETFCDSHDVVVTFADTGTGLTEETKEKLFEPFYTTKEVGKGTGLGLAICKDIIERYSGQITVENHSEGGCVFTIRIPLEYTRRSTAKDGSES